MASVDLYFPVRGWHHGCGRLPGWMPRARGPPAALVTLAALLRAVSQFSHIAQRTERGAVFTALDDQRRGIGGDSEHRAIRVTQDERVAAHFGYPARFH